MQRPTLSESFSNSRPQFLASAREVPLIDRGQGRSHRSFTCQTVAFIHHAKQLMFSLYAPRYLRRSVVIRLGFLWRKKKSHKNLLSLVTRTKLFASGRGWELEITCWRVSRLKKMTFMLQQHLLQILGSIIVCTVHIIVNKLLWWMEVALKAERIV